MHHSQQPQRHAVGKRSDIIMHHNKTEVDKRKKPWQMIPITVITRGHDFANVDQDFKKQIKMQHMASSSSLSMRISGHLSVKKRSSCEFVS